MERYEELAKLLDNVKADKKPFILALLEDFVRWEEIEKELSKTALFKLRHFKGDIVADELPSFKMYNTATARKEDAIKSIAKLLDGEVAEESPLLKALNGFNSQYSEPYKVEIR